MLSENILLALIIIIGAFVLIPLSYIYAFLLIVLPKKYGYPKFALIFICYVIFVGFLVFLMTANYLNLILFLILLITPDLIGVSYLREEFVATIKKDFRIKSGKEGP